ncbi:hypothetical protein D6745_01525 [Candidatus Woesearchaeota archaeon]|nr:MAG: hypothetical protein D6745_01525 [Candidatus Woesearchaeota archaeon]
MKGQSQEIPRYEVKSQDERKYKKIERLLTYNGKVSRDTPLSRDLSRLVSLKGKTPLAKQLGNGVSRLEDSLVRRMLRGEHLFEEGSAEWLLAKAALSIAAEEQQGKRDLGTPELIHPFLIARAAVAYDLGLVGLVSGLTHDIGEEVIKAEHSDINPEQIMNGVNKRILEEMEKNLDRYIPRKKWAEISKVLDDAATISARLTRRLSEPYHSYIVGALHNYYEGNTFNPRLAYVAAVLKYFDRLFNTLDVDSVGEESLLDPKKRFKLIAKNILLENETRVLRNRRDFKIEDRLNKNLAFLGHTILYFTELEAAKWMGHIRKYLPRSYNAAETDEWIQEFERRGGFDKRTRKRPAKLVAKYPWLRFHGKMNYVRGHFRGEHDLELLEDSIELYESVYAMRRAAQLMYVEPHRIIDNLTGDSG